MSIEAVTWALGADTGSATRKLVLIGIANHAHKDGRNAWPSRATVAEYANCDPKTVGRHVKALLADGWIRRGDQRHVEHLPHYVRPVVYDVAMSETQRLAWASQAATDEPSDAADTPTDDTPPGDILSMGPGDNLSPGADWDQGSSQTPPRDTAVSHKPSLNQEPPLPPASGGSPVDDQTTATSGRCSKPGPTPHRNCRGCGTTNRQVAERERREKTARAREAEQARLERENEARRAARRPAEDVSALLTSTRRQLANARGGAR